METKNADVALYMTKYNMEVIYEVTDWIKDTKDYVRLTKIIDIEFTYLSQEKVLKGRLASLDYQIKSVKADAEQDIQKLKEKKQKLMVITDQSK